MSFFFKSPEQNPDYDAVSTLPWKNSRLESDLVPAVSKSIGDPARPVNISPDLTHD